MYNKVKMVQPKPGENKKERGTKTVNIMYKNKVTMEVRRKVGQV
jgi:hypothetical protein